MCNCDSTSWALSDPAIDAFCVINMPARQANAGLGSKLLYMANATHVSLRSIDQWPLPIQVWHWHVYHVLWLNGFTKVSLAAARVHARQTLGFTLDSLATVTALLDFAAKEILVSVVTETCWIYLGCAGSLLVCLNSMSSQFINWIADDNVIFDHICLVCFCMNF